MLRKNSSKGSRTVRLRSFPSKTDINIPTSRLKVSDLAKIDQDARRVNRQRFGRGISPDRIESSFLSAFQGNMRNLTDLSRETVDTDPHLGSVINKRISAISSLPFEVIPASGFSVDPEKAAFYAEVVREQLLNMEHFRRFIMQLSWALYDGRSILECNWTDNFTYNSNDGLGKISMILRGLGWVHPRRINFGPSRELLIQDETRGYTYSNFSTVGLDINKIPYKFLYWTPQRFGDYPEREGLSIRCMYWSFFKRFSARERMILVELYGKPWRIMKVDSDSTASSDELSDADTIVDQLGSSYSARLPRGVDLEIHNPQRLAGQVHKDVIEDSDKQLSKLVLGQTGTTDAVPAGLNSKQANVMQDEQLMLLKTDAMEVSEVLEKLTDSIIVVNFGPKESINAPRFVLRSDLPADRESELSRLKLSLDAGLEVAREEAYEVSGFRIPNEDEIKIKIDQPPIPPLSPVPPAPRPVLVFPPDSSPAVGEQQPIAPYASTDEGAGTGNSINVGSADIAKTMTVNEAREAQGKSPLDDERGDKLVSEISVSKLDTQPNGLLTEPEEKIVVEPEEEIDENVIEATKITATIRKENGKWVVYDESGTRSFGEYDTLKEAEERLNQIERFKQKEASKIFKSLTNENFHSLLDRKSAAILAASTVEVNLYSNDTYTVSLLAGQEQPDTENGSPETILERGRFEVYKSMRDWVDEYEKAVSGLGSVEDILNAISRTSREIDLMLMARPYERRMTQSFSLGALDSNTDIAADEESEGVEESERVSVFSKSVELGKTPDFSNMRFEDAVRYFISKEVITRAEFERLSALAKQRAFTVAGMQNQQLLELIRDELAKTIERGDDIRKFRKFIEERVKSAGFVATKIKGPFGTMLSAAHTDTVYRTNLLNSYGAGRHAHMSQPKVKIARPVWEVSVVRDSRTRKTHAAVHGVKLSADDPFWRKAYTPFGWNCRCRVKTRSRKFLSQIVSGSTISGLPDRGFSSGVSRLL